MNDLVLVTGAGGNVGREVVLALEALGTPVRAAVFDDADAARVPGESVEKVLFDFGDQSTYEGAFEGVNKMFLMRPPQISDIETYIKPAIDYAAAHGVEQIVFLSLVGAERNKVVPHAKVEEFLIESGAPYTLLRCGFFMQNLDTTHRADLVEYSDIFIPAGRGKTSFIDARDIGAVAAVVLSEPGHGNKAYVLTGEEALSYDEVAEIMTEELERSISYSDPSMLAFARRMRQRGHPWGYITVMEGIYLTTRLGMADTITDDVVTLLGRPPITMRDYVHDYRTAWEPEGCGCVIGPVRLFACWPETAADPLTTVKFIT